MPWFRSGKDSWFVTLAGKQIDLGIPGPKNDETERLAIEALKILLAGHSARIPTPATAPPQPTVRECVDRFLAEARARDLSRETILQYRRYLDDLASHFPGPLSEIRVEQIEAWGRRPTWKQSTRHNALCYAGMLFKYAGHPLRLRIPAKTSAGAKSVITPEVHERILSATKGDFRQMIRFLWAVGCRPLEAASVTSDMVDLKASVVLLDKHKTVQYSGKPRVIYLTEDAITVVREQMAKYPGGGHLFRNRTGGPWRKKTWSMRFITLQRRLGIKVSAKFYRHTFATEGLAKGLPEAHIAELLGHGSTRMISKHYGHLNAMSKVLHESAAKVRGSTTPAGEISS